MDSTHQPQPSLLAVAPDAGAPPSSPHGSSTVSLITASPSITQQPQHSVLAVAPDAEAPPSSPHGSSTVSLTTAPPSITQQPQHTVLAVAPEAEAPPSSPRGSSTVILTTAPPSITQQPQHTVLAVAPEAEAPPSSPRGSSTVARIAAPPSMIQQLQHSVLAVAPDAEAPLSSPRGSSTVARIAAPPSMIQQPVLPVASEAKAPPSGTHSSSTVARIAAPPSSSKLAAGTMAQSWFATMVVFNVGIICGLLCIISQMEGELPFYLTNAVGFFVAVSVICAGCCYPKNNRYRTFMIIHVYVGSVAVYIPATWILLEISSLKMEWMLFGVMAAIVLACLVHDYIVELPFRLGELVPMFLAGLIWGWGFRCAHGKAIGEVMVFYTPVFAVLLAVIFAYELMPKPH